MGNEGRCLPKLAKIMFAVRAKPGLTRGEALSHLRDRHAPLVAASATNRQRLLTYVQNRALEFGDIPALTADRDWIIESWRDLDVELAEPPVAADAILLREDEARFPDRATLLTLQVEEIPVWQRRGADDPLAAQVKLFTYFRYGREPGTASFREAWAREAERLSSVPDFRRHVASFVRNLAVPGKGPPSNLAATPSASAAPPFDGVDIWRFDTVEAVAALFNLGRFKDVLKIYEASMFSPGSHFRFLASEHLIFDDAGIFAPAQNL
jgi:hypothetical protein